MINKIITAYRAQIYDRSLRDFWNVFKANRKMCIFVLGITSLVLALLVAGFISRRTFLAISAALIEIIAVIWVDRYAVKQHRRTLGIRNEHLVDVAEFLRTVIPEMNLYNQDQISELVNRLTAITEENRPFSKVSKNIKSFASAIVVPIVTFIAGVCSDHLQQMDVSAVIVYGICVIVSIGLIWLLASTLFSFIRPIFCRDFDAAVSLREDLLDLQLLHFPQNTTK